MTYLRLAPLAITLFAMFATQVSADESPNADLTPTQLRAGLLDAQRRIHSVYIEYRLDGYDEKRLPKGTYLHRIVAAKAPSYLFHVSAHGHARLDWHDDFLQQRAYVTADHVYNEFSVNRIYFDYDLRPDEELPGSLPGEFFFIATGIWPLDARKPPQPDGRAFVLREIAASQEYSFVRPHQENIEGRWCHVLELPGCDCLWIDVERGYALMAREWYDKQTAAIVQRFELGNYREVASGIWLSGWMQNIQFDYEAPTMQGRKRKVINARATVLNAKVNDIEDSLFQFSVRPGALQMSQSSRRVQPGGLDHLEELALWVERNAQITKFPSGLSLGYLAGLPLVLLILGWECWNKWHRLNLGSHKRTGEDIIRSAASVQDCNERIF